MNNGFMYNFGNPAFTEDIGMAQIARMYPTNIDPLTGLSPNFLPGVNLYPGQPMTDSYMTPKQKFEGNIIKTVVAGIILAGVGFLGVKKGAVWTRQILSKITSPFTNGWQRLKNLFSHNTP